jgi:hypothetical protein
MDTTSKNNELSIRSSAAEFLPFSAATGDEHIGVYFAAEIIERNNEFVANGDILY